MNTTAILDWAFKRGVEHALIRDNDRHLADSRYSRAEEKIKTLTERRDQLYAEVLALNKEKAKLADTRKEKP